MNKKSVVQEKENPIINPVSLIDNIVQARNNAFTLERSKDLNLAIFKDQSKYFSDEKNKDQLLEFLDKLENKKDILKTHGNQYLDNLDAPISTTFKNVPNVLKNNILDILEDIEQSLETIIKGEENGQEVINFPEAITDLNAAIDTAVKQIVMLLQKKINPFNYELTEKIKLSSEILKCCTKDIEQKEKEMDQKEIEKLETNRNTSRDAYAKKYLEYKNNVDILKTGILALENIQRGICGILNNLEIIEAYYNSFKNRDRLINISATNKDTIQDAIHCIRSLTILMKKQIHILKNFTEDL
ncbi:MAG: hypothetical protein V4471_02595 [Pseudomonadota bacterium]